MFISIEDEFVVLHDRQFEDNIFGITFSIVDEKGEVHRLARDFEDDMYDFISDARDQQVTIKDFILEGEDVAAELLGLNPRHENGRCFLSIGLDDRSDLEYKLTFYKM